MTVVWASILHCPYRPLCLCDLWAAAAKGPGLYPTLTSKEVCQPSNHQRLSLSDGTQEPRRDSRGTKIHLQELDKRHMLGFVPVSEQNASLAWDGSDVASMLIPKAVYSQMPSFLRGFHLVLPRAPQTLKALRSAVTPSRYDPRCFWLWDEITLLVWDRYSVIEKCNIKST